MTRQTDDVITFMSIPAPTTLSVGLFGRTLSSKVPGSYTDVFLEGSVIKGIGDEAALETITLNRNGKLRAAFFFVNYGKLPQSAYFKLYQTSAAHTCQWFNSLSNKRIPNTS
jgi:hypothetical protein